VNQDWFTLLSETASGELSAEEVLAFLCCWTLFSVEINIFDISASNFAFTFSLQYMCEQNKVPSKASLMFSGTQDKCIACSKTVYPIEKVKITHLGTEILDFSQTFCLQCLKVSNSLGSLGTRLACITRYCVIFKPLYAASTWNEYVITYFTTCIMCIPNDLVL